MTQGQYRRLREAEAELATRLTVYDARLGETGKRGSNVADIPLPSATVTATRAEIDRIAGWHFLFCSVHVA